MGRYGEIWSRATSNYHRGERWPRGGREMAERQHRGGRAAREAALSEADEPRSSAPPPGGCAVPPHFEASVPLPLYGGGGA